MQGSWKGGELTIDKIQGKVKIESYLRNLREEENFWEKELRLKFGEIMHFFPDRNLKWSAALMM